MTRSFAKTTKIIQKPSDFESFLYLAWASVIEGCFYLEIYSLTILLQRLFPKIND